MLSPGNKLDSKTNRLKVKRWKKYMQANSNCRKSETILISDKINSNEKKLLKIKRVIL